MRVVTYSLAYEQDTNIELCARHATKPPDEIGALGQVQCGAHDGTCEVCELLAAARGFATAEIARAERAEMAAKAPDARRMIRHERVELMAACQRDSPSRIRAAHRECARVRKMWS